jgi:hypothetical protein
MSGIGREIHKRLAVLKYKHKCDKIELMKVSQQEFPLPLPAPAPEAVGLPTVGPFERLEDLRATAGFYATSNRELNEGFSILAFNHHPGGAAAHIAEILGHQQTANTADPQAAARKVTNEYAKYANKARADKTALLGLQEEVFDSVITDTRRSLHDIRAVTGLGQFIRFHDLNRLATSKDASKFPFSPLGNPKAPEAFDPYTAAQPEKLVHQRIEAIARTIPVWQSRNVIGKAVEDQEQRFAFWTKALDEIREHVPAVRPVAYAALQSLGIEIDDRRA